MNWLAMPSCSCGSGSGTSSAKSGAGPVPPSPRGHGHKRKRLDGRFGDAELLDAFVRAAAPASSPDTASLDKGKQRGGLVLDNDGELGGSASGRRQRAWPPPREPPPMLFMSPNEEKEPLSDTVEEEQVEQHHGDDKKNGSFHGAGKFLLAGGIAGAVSRSATAPFDRLKVFLITTTRDSGSKSGSPRGSLLAAVKILYKQGGIKHFWTGNGLNIIKIFPESAIKFLTYESAKRLLAKYWDKVEDQSEIGQSSRFLAGGLGGVASQAVIYPIETLKTRVMSSTGGTLKGYALISATFRDIYTRGGIRLFFRGLPAGLIGVFPYSAIDMSTYETIKMAYINWRGVDPGIAWSLSFGAISGGLGATSVYPLNLVRTRLQAQGTPAHPRTYTGIFDAARVCWMNEGWRGFYKGLTPTLVKVVPAVAISYTVYDRTKRFLFEREEEQHHQQHLQECAEVDDAKEPVGTSKKAS